MRQQQTYYVIDPQTGQPVPVVSQVQPQVQPQAYGQPQYAQGQYAQPGYEQPAYEAQVAQPQYAQPQYAPPPAAPKQAATATNSRGLFSRSPAYAQQSYGQPAYAQQYQPQTYQQPAYQQRPAYAPQPQAQPAPPASSNTTNRGFFTSRNRAPTYQQQPAYAAQPAPQYGAGGPYVAAPMQAYASAPSNAPQTYTLDSGDKLRIVVFGQEGITNSYLVGVDGNVNLPLIGSVPARGFTPQQLSGMISERLKQGYVREPHVSVEVENYRPFFILGEVTTPGQYPYVANMTAETAIAIAGGFAARANKRTVELTRSVPRSAVQGQCAVELFPAPRRHHRRQGTLVLTRQQDSGGPESCSYDCCAGMKRPSAAG